MTLQFPEDPQIDAILKMTNDVVAKIKAKAREKNW